MTTDSSVYVNPSQRGVGTVFCMYDGFQATPGQEITCPQSKGRETVVVQLKNAHVFEWQQHGGWYFLKGFHSSNPDRGSTEDSRTRDQPPKRPELKLNRFRFGWIHLFSVFSISDTDGYYNIDRNGKAEQQRCRNDEWTAHRTVEDEHYDPDHERRVDDHRRPAKKVT